LWQDHDDNEAVEAVLAERKVGGKTEYKVRWVGFDASHDEWLPEERFTSGMNSLVRNWQARNKKKAENQQIQSNKKQGKKADKPKAYKPDRKAKVGDVIAIYAGGKSEKGVFFMGKVLEVLPGGKLKVHWWSGARGKMDGVWSPEYKRPKGKQQKGTAGPYTGRIELASVMDRVPSLNGQKKGKVPAGQLKELIKLFDFSLWHVKFKF